MSLASLTATGYTAAGRVVAEVGAESARTRAPFAGIVGLEGGGTAPHPMGGGVAEGMAVRDTTTARSASGPLSARDRR
jgi:hypothetical protein